MTADFEDDNRTAAMLACATRFVVLPEFFVGFGQECGGIVIERMEQLDGSYKWAVTRGMAYNGMVLTTGGRWVWARRSDAWLRRTRFETLAVAWQAATWEARRMLARVVKAHGLAPYRTRNGQAFPFPTIPD